MDTLSQIFIALLTIFIFLLVIAGIVITIGTIIHFIKEWGN